MDYTRFETVSLKAHPELTVNWVQARIVEDPALLNLGNVVLKDMERLKPKPGRFDLLLQGVDSNRRYDLSVQLGPTDESHIIRTIEHWDLERRRLPQYSHTAVLVAEEVSSRFLNIISLFNGMIPLVAIQMRALKAANHIGLMFTTVVDKTTPDSSGTEEEIQEVSEIHEVVNAKDVKEVAKAERVERIQEVREPRLFLKPTG